MFQHLNKKVGDDCIFVFTYDENDDCWEKFDRSEHVIKGKMVHVTRYKDGKVVERSKYRCKFL